MAQNDGRPLVVLGGVVVSLLVVGESAVEVKLRSNDGFVSSVALK